MEREAEYYRRTDNGKVECVLCPRRCVISEGKTGFCMHRTNRDGTLMAALYGKVAAAADDPIEKKPLYHFHPGRGILSIGSFGCNLACRFCQNWHLVEGKGRLRDLPVEDLVSLARSSGSIGVAYTYNEPLIWFEYIKDAAKAVRAAGMVNVLVTNGYLEPEPFDEMLGLVDAMNIDLKGIRDSFYREYSKGMVEPVKRNIAAAAGRVHLEVTNLLVTGANDTREEIRDLVDFIARTDPEIPLHFSRYFPNYRYDKPPTDTGLLAQAYRIASEKLSYVYLGNMATDRESNTYCPSCGGLLVDRRGYATRVVGLAGRDCAECGARTNFVI